jgi:hypothetical protein
MITSSIAKANSLQGAVFSSPQDLPAKKVSLTQFLPANPPASDDKNTNPVDTKD